MRLAYIQVGGRADGAADAAPSPSALRASGAEAKRTPERTNKRKPDRKRGGREAAPLNRLGRAFAFFPPRIAFFYGFFPLLFCAVSGGVLCHFREQCYHFGADLSDIFAIHPAPEAVEEKYFPVL